MARIVVVLLCGSILLSQSGCSLFGGTLQGLTVSCADKDADLYVDGNPIDKGSAQTMVARDQNHLVMANRGDRSQTVIVGTRLSGLGILDIIGGFIWLIPFIGLTAAGSRNLDKDQVTIVLP
jgi:hypothetical protein